MRAPYSDDSSPRRTGVRPGARRGGVDGADATDATVAGVTTTGVAATGIAAADGTTTDGTTKPGREARRWSQRSVLLRARVRVALADPMALGLVGSMLLALGSLGAGTLPKFDPFSPPPLVQVLHDHLLGRVFGTSCVIAGVGVLLSVWLALGRELRAEGGVRGRAEDSAEDPRAGGTLLGLGRMRRMLAVWAAPLVLAPPLFSRDPYSYAAQGNLLHTGFDPYQVGPWVEPGRFADSVDPLWSATRAPYGPLFLTLARGVCSVVGDHVYLAVIGVRCIALVGVLLLTVYVPRLARSCGVDPRGAFWLGLLNPLVLMHFVSGAHNDALMIGLAVMGMSLALEGHPAVGSAVVALGAGVKAPAVLVLAFVGHAWARRLDGRQRVVRGMARAGLVSLGTFVLLTAVTGLGYGWIAALSTPATVRSWVSPATALGMVAGWAGRLLGLGNHTYELVGQSRVLFGALAVTIIGLLLLRRRPVHPVRGAALALFLLVVLGPVVQPWYLMWGLVLIAAGGVRARDTSVREAAVVSWGVVVAVLISQLNGTTMVGGLAVPGTLACLVLTYRVVARARDAERAELGERAVFDLAVVRPTGRHGAGDPSAPHAWALSGGLPTLARPLS